MNKNWITKAGAAAATLIAAAGLLAACTTATPTRSGTNAAVFGATAFNNTSTTANNNERYSTCYGTDTATNNNRANPTLNDTHGQPIECHAWTYHGTNGPDAWGGLAATGTQQSPIDIASGTVGEGTTGSITFYTTPGRATATNNGHTINWTLPSTNTFTVGDQTYTFKQFHFHAPSEHTIDGQPAAMELHFVHQADTGELAVVGVLVEQSWHNPAFDTIVAALPTAPNATATPTGSIDLAALLPVSRNYWHYDGSLTTPPCTEGVRWFVMQEAIGMSPEQIARFTTIYSGNNRPIQRLNGRLVMVPAGAGSFAAAPTNE